ncbi:hypothetical protein [Actinocrispum wychmicini]|uniref:Uncharacterized protein n=1 Tax=Actinocrispum wychmicini TaxID=1213861 RepID=A0A4R2JUJ7_9PSEU|nr:hypothetical protein [Actinocrispum wychmicini]TCO62722.1 hypothetical protein EV192_102861 [Actinocrispum wychmicini]
MRKHKWWLRGIAFLLAGLLGMTSFVAPTREASAGGQTLICWWVWSWPHHRWELHCRVELVYLPYEERGGCLPCGLKVNYREDPAVDPDTLGRIDQSVVAGLVGLGDAEFSQDPARRGKLRDAALTSFTDAAQAAGQSTLRLDSVGIANPERNTYEPRDIAPLAASGGDVADGIALLQRSFADPKNAAQLRAAAVAQFDEAYQELSRHVVIQG